MAKKVTEQLSEHFTREEMQCPCCKACAIDPALLSALEALRALIQKPIRVNSAFRCPAHNAAVGGANGSQHVRGKAADIRVRGLVPASLARRAEEVPAFENGGIGVYPREGSAGWVHVDTRGHRARWVG